MKKKSLTVYNIISSLTLILPITVYLILMATIFKIQPDMVMSAEFDNVIIEEYENNYLIYSDLDTTFKGGNVIYHNDMIKAVISKKDIVKLDNGFYQINDKGVLADVSKKEVENTRASYITFTVVVGLVASLIVILIIKGKMEWHKKYKRTAVLISLVLGTVILYVMDLIVGHFFWVFLVFTLSWIAYMIEYGFYKGKIDEVTRDKLREEIKRGY